MDKNLEKQLKLVTENTIYEVRHGSHAYGTNIATSDVDIKGICLIPDPKLFFGMGSFEQQDGGWEQDKVVYHLPKFMQLAGACNPNIIEVLFADDSDILKITPAGEKLRKNRDLFISLKARHTFTGYAHSQLKRMQAHKRWIDNAPEKPESAASKHVKTMPIGPLGTHVAQSGFLKEVRIAAPTTFLDKMLGYVGLARRDQKWFDLDVEVFDKGSYEAAKKEWENYQTWKNNRNEKRAALEREYGYDTKHAMHLVRLLRMGYEIVTEGKVVVKRPDREELISIRNGAWTYDKLIAYADEMEQKITEAEKTSDVRYSPNWEAIENLQMELITDALKQAGKL